MAGESHQPPMTTSSLPPCPKALVNSTITASMNFTKTSPKFGQWSDHRANTVYGLGFSSERDLHQVCHFPPIPLSVTCLSPSSLSSSSPPPLPFSDLLIFHFSFLSLWRGFQRQNWLLGRWWRRGSSQQRRWRSQTRLPAAPLLPPPQTSSHLLTRPHPPHPPILQKVGRMVPVVMVRV